MSSITQQTVGNNTYLYESHSFRDGQGRPRNHKTRIGKIDRKTGRAVYTEEYADRMREAGTPVDIPSFDGIDGLEERISQALDSLKDYGLFYFLKKIAEKTKLLEALKETIPRYWEQLCMLSFYLVAGDKPLMYMEDWIAGNESYPVGTMSSQRISELLCAFGQQERNGFFSRWCGSNRTDEYLALDITSISSYSGLIRDCERGYNRDGEDLSQINVCLLYGEKSGLPVYQTSYSGSLGDVSTFKTTVAEMEAVSGGKKLVLVMDKGFYSEKNVKLMLERYQGSEFLIAVPFTSSYAKRLVEEEREKIERFENLIKTQASPGRGVLKRIKFAGFPLSAYVLYNPERNLALRNDLYTHVNWLKEAVEAGKKLPTFEQEIKKYFLTGREKARVEINQEAIERDLATSGWMVMLGNGNLGIQEAHDIYRKKDVVEKAFMKYKNLFGLDRLRIHGDERMRNKLFTAFLSLVLVSHIHNVMKEKELYRKMTMEKLFITMSKLKIVAINGRNILRPLTKEQLEILKAFAIPKPLVG
jgi:transposase